ncbi:MAG: hypothetical protein QGH60_23250 [Phycisphaerae bacterium]|jgi:hypothetical protein|nr:hypothetical protein [Phycisphaerae bacterium]
MNGIITKTKLIAVALVVSTAFCATLAPGQARAPVRVKTTAKTDTGDWRTRAKAAIARTLSKYTYQYKPAADQKAKLEKVLIAQYKDLMDHDKIHTPKIKTVDEKIAAVNEKVAALQKGIADKVAALQAEVATLKKQKAGYSTARAELLLDHKAELDNVFSEQQRVASIAKYLRQYTAYRYWGGFSKAQQADLNEQFEAAALKVIQAGPEKSDAVLSTVRKEMHSVVSKLTTPEVRQAGEAKYLNDSTVRAFYRVKLTDNQKAQIRELCDKASKRKSELYAQYKQLDKDRDAVRKSMYKYNTSDYYRKIRKEVSEKILTEEQRKATSSRSSRYRSRSSSRKRPSGSSTRKPARPATKTTK